MSHPPKFRSTTAESRASADEAREVMMKALDLTAFDVAENGFGQLTFSSRAVNKIVLLVDDRHPLTIAELAERLNRSVRWVRAMIAHGFRMQDGRATFAEWREWRELNPDATVRKKVKKRRNLCRIYVNTEMYSLIALA